ncbi:MAG: sugar ABC transporter permease [Limnochordales bacterium]
MRWLTPRQQKALFPYLLVLPGVIAIAALLVYPLLRGIWSSFYTHQPLDITQYRFVGLEHYRALLADRVFYTALKHTVIWTVGIVAVHYALGLIIALLLNQDIPGRSVFRALILIPWVVPNISAALTWRWMYAEQFGVINQMLNAIGLASINWLGRLDTALGSVMATAIWKGTPFVAVVLLAALQTIPDELYEASAIEGANAWQNFWYVTFPLMRGVTTIILLLTAIWTFNQFDIIWIMTKGGPANVTQILPVYTYLNAFSFFKFNYAAAIGTVGVVILAVLAGFVLRASKEEE